MNVSLNHPVLEELRSRAIPFTVCGEHIELDGFGKSGVVKLVREEPTLELTLLTRYEGRDKILTFTDLLAAAWHWLKISLARNDDQYTVSETWRAAFISYGWLDESVQPWSIVTRAMWNAGEKKRLAALAESDVTHVN